MTTTYLITGASRGIGLEMSRQILKSGDRLHAICRNPELALDLQTLIDASQGRGQIYRADACDDIALANVANQIHDSIDVLVCNAGLMSARGGIHDVDNNADAISKVLMTNIAGPFLTARAFINQLKRSATPKICIISSCMGSQDHQGTSVYFYRASKAGANNIMVTMSNELKADGITVASFHPGWVRTDMGGINADISAVESVSGLLRQFLSLSISHTGSFINYDGKKLPL